MEMSKYYRRRQRAGLNGYLTPAWLLYEGITMTILFIIAEEMKFDPITPEVVKKEKSFVKLTKKHQKELESLRKRQQKERTLVQKNQCAAIEKLVKSKGK